MMELAAEKQTRTSVKQARQPRLGFAGLGWIGRNRMAALADRGGCEIAALADTLPENLEAAAAKAPSAHLTDSMEEILKMDLDGLVIATPSALHADQAIRALESGLAVFCQKPLARTAEEHRAVINAARSVDRLLGVDLSYRHLTGVRAIQSLIRSGELGRIFAADLVFHNAYGPDKPWFRDLKLSGGGCVMDLGIHMVDLAFWMLDESAAASVTSRLFARGEPLNLPPDVVEDYAQARIDLAGGTSLQLACSWNLPAGRDAMIAASFWGTRGGAEVRNVNGSFYEFQAERFTGTGRETLHAGPEDWGGRAAFHWLEQLAQGGRYDDEIERLIPVAETLDQIYAHA